MLKKQLSKVLTSQVQKNDVSDVFIHQLKTDLKETHYITAAKGALINHSGVLTQLPE